MASSEAAFVDGDEDGVFLVEESADSECPEQQEGRVGSRSEEAVSNGRSMRDSLRSFFRSFQKKIAQQGAHACVCVCYSILAMQRGLGGC